MNEIDRLLKELQNMKAAERAAVLNNRDTWSKIGNKDLASLGFNSEDELKAWLLENPYESASI